MIVQIQIGKRKDFKTLKMLFLIRACNGIAKSKALWTKPWRKYFEIFEIIASIGRKYSETYYGSSQVT